MPEQLPVPDADALEHTAAVAKALRARIAADGGWISFADYMRFVLYAPGLGYYAAGTTKFGTSGDFVTAPEMTRLYGAALATQVATVIERGGDILELGAGSGRLACDLMIALELSNALPRRYTILEPSAELRERQQRTIARLAPSLVDRVVWIETLPATIEGAVVVNEVLDAIPVHVVVRREAAWHERGVKCAQQGFQWSDRPLGTSRLLELANARLPSIECYETEMNPGAEALVAELGRRLVRGALLIVDYGFPQHEYYHAERSKGTLVAHYRHRMHADPFLWPGLCDLTAHVDFTAIAEAGERTGLEVAGFSTQAAFLLGCGILDRLRDVGPVDSVGYIREASAVQKLLSPAEMGDLFKVLALARGVIDRWPGFSIADMRVRL